jgi:hypothetical protein
MFFMESVALIEDYNISRKKKFILHISRKSRGQKFTTVQEVAQIG